MMLELAQSPLLIDPNVRNIPTEKPNEGIGVVEAPRGTLFHHYTTDERGIIRTANLIVATQNNAARIAMSVDRAAKALIHNGKADDGLLNMIEMAFRAYDPCNGCATHSLPGQMPMLVSIYDHRHDLVGEVCR
jgi:F420-non-reducing hydrogenase large subunit